MSVLHLIRAQRLSVLLPALLLSGCGSSEAPGGTAPPPASFVAVPFVSAHRGGAAYAPENTMLAYENAARLGVDDFEADMLVTADEVLVLMHDDTLDRTTDCSGRVADHSYAEILECDAAYWFSPGQPTTSPDEARAHPLRGTGVRVPTAEELFAFAAQFEGDYAPTVTIEIKISFDGVEGLTTAGLRAAQLLVGQIQASGIQDRIIVQSFNPLAIDAVKLLDPTIRTLYLTPSGALLSLSYATLRGHEYVAPQFASPDLNAALVDSAHALGKQVVPWTADSEADIRQLIDMGVDGIITNFPACLLAIQGRLHTDRLTPAGGGDAPSCR
ncbi:glycerophosphodiester phosphodiesterase [Sinimarinibacterium flocculans]|uniref:Glycerophosphoryl diester phosphodiesterase n=1 Tax=Sinimarinibacterium flocculans TaxID=985250 RepID=A0A318ECW6_9GAMM|nr:glycerophosphodiester phosphodiesterase family protein [Sinimarinibacterium flocculans]PXV67761.1 glycerophosphoryl diester phosphodiesterase [Sinimarinibacterium flocculans]